MPRPSRVSLRGWARSRTATAPASSSWSPIWASKNSAVWCWRSENSCPTMSAGSPIWTTWTVCPTSQSGQACPTNGAVKADGFDAWLATNVYWQRQPGYAVITLNLPLGDLSSHQALALADIARTLRGRQHPHHRRAEHRPALGGRVRSGRPPPEPGRDRAGDAGRRHHRGHHLLPRHRHLQAGHRRLTRAGRRIGPTPGRSAWQTMPDAVKDLKIKVSGCFNSCGQHHVADIGFFGNSRRRNNRAVPHFQVVLGGMWQENAGSYGLAVGAVPSKSVPAGAGRDHRTLCGRARGSTSPSRSGSHASAKARRVPSSTPSWRCPNIVSIPPSTPTGATRASSPSATSAWASVPAKWSRSSPSRSPRPKAGFRCPDLAGRRGLCPG